MNLKQEIQKRVEKAKERPSIQNLLTHQILHDRVLVASVDFDRVGEVYRPEQYEDKPEFGVVLLVGEGRLLDTGARVPSSVKVGDFIVFGKYSSEKVRAEGVDFLFIREEDILSRSGE